MNQINALQNAWSVYQGLAAEHLLTEQQAGAAPAFMVWQDPTAVVMGKNQNPWREVNLEQLRNEQVPLARRVSGGGTVYHDPGNLNMSWILPRETYNADTVAQILYATLEDLGLKGTPGSSGGIRVEGKKISGAAFCYRKDFVLHHGTLLLSADLPRMRRLLSPPRLQIETHAVRSIPAAVANLTDFIPDVTAEKVAALLGHHTQNLFGAPNGKAPPLSQEDLQAQAAYFQSAEWIWDQTPAFTVNLHLHSHAHVTFEVRKGMASTWTLNGEPLPSVSPAPFRKKSLPGWSSGLDIEPATLQKALTDAGWHLPAAGLLNSRG